MCEWLLEWSLLFDACAKRKLPFVEGVMPLCDFLRALDRVPVLDTRDMQLDIMDGSKTYTFIDLVIIY
jgi:hypothetical protein